MKRYTKEINGKPVVLTRNKIVINKDNTQYINPPEELILEDGWVEYVYKSPELSEEEKIERKRKEMLNRIDTFDQSEHVNLFYIGDYAVWLDKATRAGLKLRFEAEIASGKTETSL